MGKLFGADPQTFIGLAGVGDTFATCFGPLSRNRSDSSVFCSHAMTLIIMIMFIVVVVDRKVGFRLAHGESLEEILATNDGVSEGVSTVLALEQMIKAKILPNEFDFKFPIIAGVARVVKGKMHPKLGMHILMRYPLHEEGNAV